MNKVIFNIFVWPLLLAISCFTALGISTTNKLKAENLALTKQIGSLEKPKQTSGVMEGVFGANALDLNPAYEGPITIVYVSIKKVDDIVEMRGLNGEGMDGDFKYNEEDNILYLYFDEQIHESGYLKPDYENEKYFIVSPGYANPVEMWKASSDVALEQMIIAKNNEIESLNRSLSAANARANEASKMYVAKVNELETAEELVSTLTEERDQLLIDKSNLQTSLDEKSERLIEKINEYRHVCADLETANGNIAELQNKKTELESQIQTLNSDKTALQTALDNKTAEYNAKVSELETAQSTIETLTAEKAELENQVETLTTEKTTLETTISTKNARISELEEQVKALQARIAELEKGSEEPETLAAGLYEAGTTTLVKTWEQLISDGAIVEGSDNSITLVTYTSDGNTDNSTLWNNKKLVLPSLENAKSILFNNGCGGCPLSEIDFSNVKSTITQTDLMFWDCENLVEIDISNLVITNYSFERTFYSCSKLEKIKLPKFPSNFSGGSNATFADCPKLKEITYAGTIAEWQELGFTTENSGLKAGVTVKCSDGDITTE